MVSPDDQIMLAGMVVGLVYAVRQFVTDKLAVFLPIPMGIALTLLWVTSIDNIRGVIFSGIGVGLIAAGGWSQAKKAVEETE